MPARRLVTALVRPPLRLDAGRVHGPGLPPPVVAAVDRLRAELAEAPFRAPTADRLGELGLTPPVLAVAERAGTILRLPGDIVLLPGADRAALRVLHDLPQPFTVGRAREALDAPRRVTIALLEHLHRQGRTERLPEGHRVPEDEQPGD
ncbi:DNA-binding protein [Actinomadura logoneensis]|uniref:DNA-binding protein n=1 Tax=Actinomadura logoneensis TaxID=2293572 RepID=A0A372JM91_9ACTN|nr:DNA-binding protein [Actinomadura logoneensis]